MPHRPQFLGERRQLVEDLVLADSDEERAAALSALLPLQREDFTGVLRAMDGLPVTVRLLDPPLREFVPDLSELSVEVAVAEATGGAFEAKRLRPLEAVGRLHEGNPMIGLRGVRLGLMIPGLFAMQVRALEEAAQALREQGLDQRPEVVVPLVGAVQEFEAVREEAPRILAGVGVEALVATMIEIPRAALTAGQIAEATDFSRYLELGIVGVRPFESIDREGVGLLVRTAVDEGRGRAGLGAGVCGETAATRTACTSSTTPGWTTCPARRPRAGRASGGWARCPGPVPGVGHSTGATARRGA